MKLLTAALISATILPTAVWAQTTYKYDAKDTVHCEHSAVGDYRSEVIQNHYDAVAGILFPGYSQNKKFVSQVVIFENYGDKTEDAIPADVYLVMSDGTRIQGLPAEDANAMVSKAIKGHQFWKNLAAESIETVASSQQTNPVTQDRMDTDVDDAVSDKNASLSQQVSDLVNKTLIGDYLEKGDPALSGTVYFKLPKGEKADVTGIEIKVQGDTLHFDY
jgi:hypothetical protein